MSIRNKLILILAFSLLVMAGGAAVAVHLFADKEAGAVFARNAAAHMDRVDDIAQAHFAAGAAAVKTLAALPETKNDAFLHGSNGPLAAAKNALRERMDSLRAVVPGMESVFCCFKNGEFLASPEDGGNESEKTLEPDARKRTWYSDAAFGGTAVSLTGAYISETTKSLAATMSAKITNDAGETIGVAGASFTLAALSDTLRDIQMGPGGYLVLFDTAGRVILDPKAQEHLLQPAAASGDAALAQLAQLPAGIHTLTRDGTRYAVYVRHLTFSRWKAAILANESLITGTADALTLQTGLVFLALFCALFALGGLAALNATRPLTALVKQSTALADGNTEALEGIPGRGPDITRLHGNFGRLTGRIMLLTQAEKERADEAEQTARRARALNRETAKEGETLREALVASRREMANTVTPVARDMAEAIQALTDKLLEAAKLADIYRGTAETLSLSAAETAADMDTFARQATETESNANASLALAADVNAKIAETTRGIEATRNAVFTVAANLENMKADLAEVADIAAAAQSLAEQANLLGFNASLDITGPNDDEASTVAKIRAIAENAMTVAGTAEAVTASLEQQHAAQMQALNKGVSAVKRAAAGNAKAENTAAHTFAGATTTAEQFRVLATALEGAALATSDETGRAKTAAATAKNMAVSLRDATALMESLTVLSARLATVAQELETDQKSLD
ncbi:MAG: hypothetical protein DELT_01745 [Desulfovibrio sp.]